MGARMARLYWITMQEALGHCICHKGGIRVSLLLVVAVWRTRNFAFEVHQKRHKQSLTQLLQYAALAKSIHLVKAVQIR